METNMPNLRKQTGSAKDEAERACAPTRGHLTKRQIESAFDMLGLKTEADRASFLKNWDLEGERPASGRFLVKLGNSSEVFGE